MIILRTDEGFLNSLPCSICFVVMYDETFLLLPRGLKEACDLYYRNYMLNFRVGFSHIVLLVGEIYSFHCMLCTKLVVLYISTRHIHDITKDRQNCFKLDMT